MRHLSHLSLTLFIIRRRGIFPEELCFSSIQFGQSLAKNARGPCAWLHPLQWLSNIENEPLISVDPIIRKGCMNSGICQWFVWLYCAVNPKTKDCCYSMRRCCLVAAFTTSTQELYSGVQIWFLLPGSPGSPNLGNFLIAGGYDNKGWMEAIIVFWPIWDIYLNHPPFCRFLFYNRAAVRYFF